METRWIETATRPGPTIEGDGFSATLEAWTLTACWPGGGWVWNHPRAVVVTRNGTHERLPIYNVTLIVQLALAVLAAVLTLLYFVPSRR